MKQTYDVVIIGAGIGGIISGCYLSKEGLKVLIVEKHIKPGGYCSSFERNGYRFDVGVHYLGGIKKGFLGRILNELNVIEILKLNRFDPTDKIITPYATIYIRNCLNLTIEEFKKNFPKERNNTDRFFKFITESNLFNIYKKTKERSFQDILDEFFYEDKIKTTIEVLLYNFGLSATQASAMLGTLLYKDYILDGGYYPNNGMQGFVDILLNKFKNTGGELLLNTEVTKILTENKKVKGIIVDSAQEIKTDVIISNIDVTQTFNKFLSDDTCKEKKIVNKLTLSPSLFIMYLGINVNLRKITDDTCNIWSFNTDKTHEFLTNLHRCTLEPNLPFVMISFPSAHSHDTIKNTMQIFVIAPFKSAFFWENYKTELEKKIFVRLKALFKNFDKYIDKKIIATPITLQKCTQNRNGAAFGWASTVNQTQFNTFSQKTSIKGLFLASHWCTIGGGYGGVAKVAIAGRRAAALILKTMNRKWKYPEYGYN